MRALSKSDFLQEYGPRPDTAAKRKALANGVVPAELVEQLQRAVDGSGVPLAQTAKGWGVKEAFEAVRALLGTKGKRKEIT